MSIKPECQVPVEADTHCHTLASSHAYSTVAELARYAAAKGLKAIAVTDHGPELTDGCHLWHFSSLKSLPPMIEGVRVLHGAEANIQGFDGKIDIPERITRQLDWVIASYHEPVTSPGTADEHTQSYLKLAENPFVDVIGHSGSDKYRYDYEKAIPVFKKYGKLVELNSHSFEARKGAKKNCREIALICKKHLVPVVVNSDAHSCFAVGEVTEAFKMLKEIDFPEDLIVNLKYDRLMEWICRKRKRLSAIPER
ncbi:MAG TPA: phosphatase [Clostridia bacterium]|nr:phosphatase [Clostridia bacterium]